MSNLQRRRSLALIAGMTLGASSSTPSFASPAAPGAIVRWPQVRLLDGSVWDSTRTDGKAVVAVFWSITCPFCIRHNAHIETLRQSIRGQALELITIARENNAPGVQEYMARNVWRFAVTLNISPMADALSLRKLTPLTVTVDRQGRLKQVIPGEVSEDDVLALQRLAS